MALDDILGKLTGTKNGTKKANNEYSSKFLISASNNFKKLEEADIRTPQGLEIYKNITGDNPNEYSPRVLETRKRAHLDKREDLGLYVNRHFGNLVGELDESIKPRLAYAFCPTGEISDETAKNYNKIRKVVSNAKEKIQKIEADPERYFNEEIKKESPLMKQYLPRYANELIASTKNEAQRNAMLAIQKHGATRFLTDTKKYSDTQMIKLREKQSVLETKMKAQVDSAEQGKGRILTSIEYATLTLDNYRKSQKLSKEYESFEASNGLMQSVASYAIKTIEEKKNKTKNSK